MKTFWFQAKVISKFNFSSKRADILVGVYVKKCKNVSQKGMKEMKENKNASTTI